MPYVRPTDVNTYEGRGVEITDVEVRGLLKAWTQLSKRVFRIRIRLRKQSKTDPFSEPLSGGLSLPGCPVHRIPSRRIPVCSQFGWCNESIVPAALAELTSEWNSEKWSLNRSITHTVS